METGKVHRRTESLVLARLWAVAGSIFANTEHSAIHLGPKAAGAGVYDILGQLTNRGAVTMQDGFSGDKCRFPAIVVAICVSMAILSSRLQMCWLSRSAIPPAPARSRVIPPESKGLHK